MHLPWKRYVKLLILSIVSVPFSFCSFILLCCSCLILFYFVEGNASLGKTTYVHCKAGRGRSTTIVLCYLVRVSVNLINSLLQDIVFSLSDNIFAMQVQHKHMTPEEAYAYVRSIRPRVKLASTQWKVIHMGTLFVLFFFFSL